MNELEAIKELILQCEEMQDSNESDFTKEREKISAYERIKEILNIKKGVKEDGK